MTERAYSATRNKTVSVARETATPKVIDPAIRTIVTIAYVYRHHPNGAAAAAGHTACNAVNSKVCDDAFRMRSQPAFSRPAHPQDYSVYGSPSARTRCRCTACAARLPRTARHTCM